MLVDLRAHYTATARAAASTSWLLQGYEQDVGMFFQNNLFLRCPWFSSKVSSAGANERVHRRDCVCKEKVRRSASIIGFFRYLHMIRFTREQNELPGWKFLDLQLQRNCPWAEQKLKQDLRTASVASIVSSKHERPKSVSNIGIETEWELSLRDGGKNNSKKNMQHHIRNLLEFSTLHYFTSGSGVNLKPTPP